MKYNLIQPRRRSAMTRIAALFGASAMFLFAVIGTGIDSGAAFELDANVTTQTTHDWDQVYADSLNQGNTAAALGSTFVSDGFGAGDSILTGGNTKDPLPLSGWAWKQTSSTSVQDKDDIQHPYAAAYKLPNGHTGVFFGADPFSNSGDSQMGFWFFQDPNVAINTVPRGGASGGFNGQHMDGDLLIVAHFVNGGTVPQITLYHWVGDGATGTIQQVGPVDNNLCNPASGSIPDICSITNSGLFNPPWSFTEKSSDSPAGTGLFMEGGIDLQNALGNAPCFNVFMAETRSSQTPSSTLSDFTLPAPFSTCSVDVSKSCSSGTVVTASDGSNKVHYTFTGSVSVPSGTVFQPTVTDAFPTGAFNMILNGNACASSPCKVQLSSGSLASGNTANYTGSFDMLAPLPSGNSNGNKIQATASPLNGGPQTVSSKQKLWDPNDASGQACNINVSAALSIAKGCTVNIVQSNGALALEVDAEIRVCNTVPVSSGGVQIKGVTVTDSVFGNLGTFTLNAPNGKTQSGCVHLYPSYKPSTCDSTDGRCAFSDIATVSSGVNDFGAVVAAPVPNTASATCRVCPLGACSTSSDTPFPDPGAKIVP